MSAGGCLLTGDQLLCAICLDIFTFPVTLPCGHNFCSHCITHHWDANAPCRCPMCQETFQVRPQLRINHFIAEMAARVRDSASGEAGAGGRRQSGPGDVTCDECVGVKAKALKSCLVCLTSYCETHLKPHLTSAGLKRHQLVDPVADLATRVCPQHDKPLELFCRTERTSICVLCSFLDHKSHVIVPLKDEHARRKAMLAKTEGRLHRMVQERLLKVQEVNGSAQLNQDAADRQLATGVQVFTGLMQLLEGGLADLMDTVEEQLNATAQQAGGFVAELQQEIHELTKAGDEVERLSRSEDHFHLLQNFSSQNAVPHTKQWEEVSVGQPLYEVLVRKAVLEAVERLQDTFRQERKKLLEAELRRVQQHQVDVSLDPQTASLWLLLSDDGKQVSLGDMKKNLPDKQERFYPGGGVLGRQGFSSGRFYFQVRVKEAMKWDLGVVKESINRKASIRKGQHGGHWILSLRKANEYQANGSHVVHLSVTWRLQKVAVFVDYEEGLISFYDVEAADLIHSFTDCRFTERLYPFFRPGRAGLTSNPLTICAV